MLRGFLTRLQWNPRAADFGYILGFSFGLWGINALWLALDSRPPVWDMAMHQSYALNYLPETFLRDDSLPLWARSGNYPPWVHVVIAFFYWVFHPGPHVAILANVPATILLFWAVYEIASKLARRSAARWTCLLTALIPYLMWMSRETILDYWLSAWVATSLVVLMRTRGFENRLASVLLGFALALGLLTKWLFAGFLFFPLLYVSLQHRIWKDSNRMVNLADALMIAGVVAGIWYIPNAPNLTRYFAENARIGALEGEPPVLSFQSFIYYLRLLEGFQLFAPMFLLATVSCVFVWKKCLLRDVKFLGIAIAGGWLAMTLLRTKDPRFTMPLLGLIAVFPGVWVSSWDRGWSRRAAKTALVIVLCFQAYLINFGVSWLPREIVLAHGYQGTLRWDWNLYLQHYFHILGAPRKEDWKQAEILRRIMEDSVQSGLSPSLVLIPDLPRFNAANFHLFSRLFNFPFRVDHLQSAAAGIRSFEGFDYVLLTEGDQGMPWTTRSSRALNQVVFDAPGVFHLVDMYPLPDGNHVRLYSIHRNSPRVDR